MPIYVYRCDDCGRDHEALQKLSDPVLRLCPHCGHEALAKQLSAAAFQLKGNGWYATDFRGSGKPAEAAKPADDAKPAETCKPAQAGAAAAQCASCPAAAASSD